MPSAVQLPERDYLAVENIPIVQSAAKTLGVWSSRDARRDELLSAGYEALIFASQRFDPDKASFSTYATRRVYGAMLNVLADDSGRRAVHEALSQSGSEVLHHRLSSGSDIERSVLLSQVLMAIEKLPAFSRDLIRAHCLEDENLVSVGARHGISKTRASVHLSRAIHQLRAYLDDGCSRSQPPAKQPKRRFSERDKAKILRRARSSRSSVSQLAREACVPRTTLITWLRADQRVSSG